MAVLKGGLATMLVVILLQIMVHIAEGVPVYHLPGLELYLRTNNGDINDNALVENHSDDKVFQYMIDPDFDLAAVESRQNPQFLPDIQASPPTILLPESFPEEQLENAMKVLNKNPKKDSYVLIAIPEKTKNQESSLKEQAHHRQKRFIKPYKLRLIAVPVSIFNYLGFLPIKIPGLPYHDDLPPPDYTYYNTMHDLYPPKRTKYF